ALRAHLERGQPRQPRHRRALRARSGRRRPRHRRHRRAHARGGAMRPARRVPLVAEKDLGGPTSGRPERAAAGCAVEGPAAAAPFDSALRAGSGRTAKGGRRRVVVAHFALLELACAEPTSCPPADLAPIAGEPAYAFVGSDYASSVIGVLDADGNLLCEAWIDSGTVTPTLVPAVSGDTVLGGPLAPCVVTVIDRDADVLTFLDACAERDVLLGQLDVGPTFYANPQDAIAIDETRALVSRSQPNLRPGADELERGNDL